MLYDPGIPQGAKLVYLAVSSHVNTQTGIAWPSHNKVARYLGMSRSTVRTHLDWLRKNQFIDWRSEVSEDGGKTSNRYWLIVGPHGRAQAMGGQPEDTHGLTPAIPMAAHRPSHGLTPAINEKELNESQENEEPLSARADVDELCNHLADWIERNGSKRPTVGKRWHDACRLMLDVDGRTPEQVRAAIDWCQQSEFWRSNIMSMSKLREQYERLRLRALEERQKAMPSEPDAQSRIEANRRRTEMMR